MTHYRVKTKEELLATTPNYQRLFGGAFGKTQEDENLVFGKVSIRGINTDYGDDWVGSLYGIDIRRDAIVQITADEYRKQIDALPIVELKVKPESGRITVYRKQNVCFAINQDPVGNPEFCSIQAFNQLLSVNSSVNDLMTIFKDHIIPITGDKVFMFDVHDRYSSILQALGAINMTPYVSSNSSHMLAGLLKF